MAVCWFLLFFGQSTKQILKYDGVVVGGTKWFPGKITNVNVYGDSTRTYDFRYFSGMREKGIPRHYIRRLRCVSLYAPDVLFRLATHSIHSIVYCVTVFFATRPKKQRQVNHLARQLRRAPPRLAMTLAKNSNPSQVDMFNSGLLSVKALALTEKQGYGTQHKRTERLEASSPSVHHPGYGGISVGSRVSLTDARNDDALHSLVCMSHSE